MWLGLQILCFVQKNIVAIEICFSYSDLSSVKSNSHPAEDLVF